MDERPTRIHHVALRVADPERSLAFYGGVLGLAEDAAVRRRRARPLHLDVRSAAAVVMLERAIKGAGGSEGSGHVLVFAVSRPRRLGNRGWPRRGSRSRIGRRRRSTSSTPTATASALSVFPSAPDARPSARPALRPAARSSPSTAGAPPAAAPPPPPPGASRAGCCRRRACRGPRRSSRGGPARRRGSGSFETSSRPSGQSSLPSKSPPEPDVVGARHLAHVLDVVGHLGERRPCGSGCAASCSRVTRSALHGSVDALVIAADLASRGRVGVRDLLRDEARRRT